MLKSVKGPCVWPLALLLAAVALPGFAQGADPGARTRIDPVPDKLSALGIGSYRLETEDSVAEVDLQATEGGPLGTLRLSWSLDKGTLVELDRPDANLLLLFHPLAKRMQLTDLRTQETASGTLTDEGWVLDEEARRFFELHADDIALMAEVHDDVLFNHIQGRRAEEEREAAVERPGPPGNKIYITCPPACNGPQVRGSNLVALSRSACCYKARQDAHLKCWNQYCTGCCEFDSCDAFCALGDYLCAPCGITGTSCSGGPVPPCPPCI